MKRQLAGLLLGLGFVLATACGPPEEGSRCSAGTEPYVDEGAHIYLFCTAPAGCDDPEFRWRSGTEGGFDAPLIGMTYCTCGGVTRDAAWGELGDLGEIPPNVPWQFFGSCEDPCAIAEPTLGGDCCAAGAGWPVGAPIAPQCESCVGARVALDRCEDAQGRLKPEICCECEGATRDAEGVCRSGNYDRRLVSDDCCRP